MWSKAPEPRHLRIASRDGTVSWLGESAALVTFGDRIDPERNRLVHAVADWLAERAIDGIVDIVPAYSSILLSYELARLAPQTLLEHLSGAPASLAASGKDTSKTHTIPVKYGGEEGPDLESLARGGLSTEEAIRLHSSVEYRVYFVGFMPGFAYMGTVPRAIAAPRLAVPRLSVPAGSVGIAGEQTGIYPFATPGGWNIIGRTAFPLWNPELENPAALAPGDRVRFEPTDQLADYSPSPAIKVDTGQGSAALEVVGVGGVVTVQDCGRPGLGRFGVPCGGALDRELLRQANELAGNVPCAAALEMVSGGPELVATRTLVIALAGSDFGCIIDDREVPPGISWLVRAGQRIRFRGATGQRSSNLCYMAVGGGIAVQPVLKSSSTLLSARMGGYHGRPLRSGDGLPVGVVSGPPSTFAGRSNPSGINRPGARHEHVSLRFVPYAGPNSAGRDAIDQFAQENWVLSEKSDRMGARLETTSGRSLPVSRGELLSFGTARGVIQLPPGGKPIILGPDHGTTGGYPLLGAVARADWPLLTQCPPHTVLNFRPVSLDESTAAFLET